jgi:two-component system, sensor histidine kinase RegB
MLFLAVIMPDQPFWSFENMDEILSVPDPGLRLQTLIRLRWVAVTGQLGAVLLVRFGLGFDLPLEACLAAIAMSVWLNIILGFNWPPTQRLSDKQAAALLAYDILQLAALLWLTGGLQNPFAFLFLVPVTVSATSLSLRMTIALGVLTLALAGILAITHQPLPWNDEFSLPRLYVAGLWTSLLSGSVFAALYAGRIASEARQMRDALIATEAVLAHAQQLHALDGLAAAAAHELGTPLSTIALVAKELKRGLPDPDALAEDLELLHSQALRCREILSRLSNHQAEADIMLQQLRFSVMLEEVIEPMRGSGVAIETKKPNLGEFPEPIILRNPGIIYGLSNILENAVDFAKTKVEIELRWDNERITLIFRDDGPGFSDEIYARLGDPFISTRKTGSLKDPSLAADSHEGLGLGFFIAKTLLQRSGAEVTLANRKTPETGAIVQISWPRPSLAIG